MHMINNDNLKKEHNFLREPGGIEEIIVRRENDAIAI